MHITQPPSMIHSPTRCWFVPPSASALPHCPRRRETEQCSGHSGGHRRSAETGTVGWVQDQVVHGAIRSSAGQCDHSLSVDHRWCQWLHAHTTACTVPCIHARMHSHLLLSLVIQSCSHCKTILKPISTDPHGFGVWPYNYCRYRMFMRLCQFGAKCSRPRSRHWLSASRYVHVRH